MYQGLDEIIAIRFTDNKVLFGMPAVERAINDKTYEQLISRAEFRFMADMDLSSKWVDYAETAPTLFKSNQWISSERFPGGVQC